MSGHTVLNEKKNRIRITVLKADIHLKDLLIKNQQLTTETLIKQKVLLNYIEKCSDKLNPTRSTPPYDDTQNQKKYLQTMLPRSRNVSSSQLNYPSLGS